jgi:predicted Zn-dependent protease
MNYDKHRRCFFAVFVLILLTIFLFPACQGELPDVPTKEEFTREKFEKLGSLLQPGILETYQFLPQVPPYDTTVYWYVQTLYNQATTVMHRDMQSAPGNRWDKNRLWRVFIIDDDNLRHAFTLPGGDLFISTGMLRSFKKEYELYYLLTFEANLMHAGDMLNRLILEHNSLTINNIIEGNEGANGITADILAEELPQLDYDENTIKKNDQRTVRSICETSILDPTGIGPFLLTPESEDALWLQTRPSYDGRTSVIASMVEGGCGDKKGLGNYDRFILNVLD